MALKYLKRFLYGLSIICVILMTWYMVFPSHTVMEPKNWMYFYDYEPVYKQNFLFTLRERVKCEANSPFLVILVTSRPPEVDTRQAIRITWGSQKSWWGKQVVTLFLLGKGTESDDNAALSIEDESILYGDIIQQDFLDTYDNLTLKTIMGFRWVTEFCLSAQYVMKTDADVFINTGNLVKFLLNSNASENFMTGYPLVDNHPHRGFHRKTYISYNEYPFKVYPPYCSGLGYILDTKLAHKVYEMMSHVKPLRLEDVYVGICLGILGIGISIPEDAELFFLYRIDFDICKYKHLIAVHNISPQEMIVFWQEITRETTSLPCQ
ncbi:UDP-GalNAc:beta-1,3-N-acetylgalactosaminyltransferase 1 [Sceloporus undulatus]|uniref:UDP-GalNAc:beta-1, 3-N-acetylgalactosaminyltransferase 1 n=1 Tax=Sceloporus undulatus TaxID=8520 RepID=UPI001C4A809A|nr:UDP-GalNAc:beta-1,3-N-acetylgalactosaminyltransferase 1 [Sceloporus undulatus]XP_042316560.1 UDP-GalNAc:beta-1,3-N-acetylgalactosaminyltransferase 1 [Sceloporus undulatus]XP_042316561.1 UDP-GalNAc:beta-1,3-N-acetylgalactosaminyltransferase 1 [Sceloporus undulatus]XP_042316562.1 UDP-GalNAc:beta-1,3-N-acetylgalactosaminyltransferase 1 [Sceloporus undulatus]